MDMIFRGARSGTHALVQGAIAAALLVFAVLEAVSPAAADSGPLAGLAGSWSGGGTVSVSNGTNERIRCRATYDVRERGTSLELTLRCASDSYNFNLQGSVHDQGGAISGSWTETTRNASGGISGRASGNQILVRADGPSFAANLLVYTRGDHQSVSIRATGSDITGVDVALSRR